MRFVPRETSTLPPFHVKHYFYESLTAFTMLNNRNCGTQQKACQSVLANVKT